MEWKGVSLLLITTNLNKQQEPDVKRTDHHTVLINLPVTNGKIPEPYQSDNKDIWSGDYVRLPCSKQNLYAVGENLLRNRWELIKEIYQSPVLSSQQFETAVLSYNSKFADRWNFSALHKFFSEACSEVECDIFFEQIFPNIVKLAFQLPELIAAGIPLLKRHSNRSITFSQLQVASLLANALLCTFPRRNTIKSSSEYGDYPSINFNQLFQVGNPARGAAVHEKLKCLIHYFRRVTSSPPTGVITYSRYFVPHLILPDWKSSKKRLQKLHVSSSGTIEDAGAGLLHMDFAHKLVGGGVLGQGAVQEEIRFVICPELILARLFIQSLDETEVLVVTGCERYSNYKGYGNSFTWDGNYVDNTPSDEYGRKYGTVLAVDALSFGRNSSAQFYINKIKRELNKVYVGFSWGAQTNSERELSGVATGNWGCGVYRGDVYLKTVLQLMASAETIRSVAYFTFGDEKLRDEIYNLHRFLLDNNIVVGTLWEMLCEYSVKRLQEKFPLFDFLYRAVVNRSIPQQVKLPIADSSKNVADEHRSLNTDEKSNSSSKKKIDIITSDEIRQMLIEESDCTTNKVEQEKPDVDTRNIVNVLQKEKNKWTDIKAFERELNEKQPGENDDDGRKINSTDSGGLTTTTIKRTAQTDDNVVTAAAAVNCDRRDKSTNSWRTSMRGSDGSRQNVIKCGTAKLAVKRKITDYFGNNSANKR